MPTTLPGPVVHSSTICYGLTVNQMPGLAPALVVLGATMATTLEGLTPGQWIVDPAHSEVGFVVRHMMIAKVKGRFSGVSGTVTVAENVLDSTVEATAEAASIDTRDEGRDAHLRSGDFFDAETFPTLSFRSTGIREQGGD